MKLKTLTVMLVSILTLSHCNKSVNSRKPVDTEEIKIDEQKNADARFVLEKSVEADFIAYARITVSPWQDKIILYGLSADDNKKQMLVAQTYDKTLRFIGGKTFFFGQGPGDVGNFNMISIGKDRIFISENSNDRVSIYSNDWTYQTSLRHRVEVDAFEIFDNGKIFIGPLIIGEKNNRFAYSFLLGFIPGFKTKHLFTTDPFFLHADSGNSPKLLIGGDDEYSSFYNNNEAFILICDKYRILKFIGSGEKLRDIVVKVPVIKTDHSRRDEYLKELGFSKERNPFEVNDTVNPAITMIPLMKGFVVLRRHEFASACGDGIEADYFSYQLEYLGKTKVPCSSKLLRYITGRTHECAKYDNGFLYLIDEKEESITIEKWKVME